VSNVTAVSPKSEVAKVPIAGTVKASTKKLPVAKPEKVSKPTEDDDAEVSELTEDDVREVAGRVRIALGGKANPQAKAAIDKVLKKYGGTVIADVDPKNYPKLIDSLNALAPEDDGDNEDFDEEE